MTTIAEAAPLAAKAFWALFDRQPTTAELRLLLAKGRAESGLGDGWHQPPNDPGPWPPNNIGAIQATAGWKGGTFVYTDHHSDGTPYQTKWRRYATTLDGWVGFVAELFIAQGGDGKPRRASVLAGASADDPWRFSQAVVATGYTEGVAKSKKLPSETLAQFNARTLGERQEWHYQWMAQHIAAVDAAMKWPAPARDSHGGAGPSPAEFPVTPWRSPDVVALVEAAQAMTKNTANLLLAVGQLHSDLMAIRADLASYAASASKLRAAE